MNKGSVNIAPTIPEHHSEHTRPSNDNAISLQTARYITRRGMPRTDAAFYVGISPRMFDGVVKSGVMPPPRLIGSKKVWDRDELDESFHNLPRPQSNDDLNDWDEL